MTHTLASALPPSAERLLAAVAAAARGPARPADIERLVAEELLVRSPTGGLALTEAGRAHLARLAARTLPGELDPFLAQHVQPALRTVQPHRKPIWVNETESPMAWLARRKGRDGRPLITALQLAAGERLRADFTSAQLMPRVTANWTASVSQGRRAIVPAATTPDALVAARQQVRRALDSVGPEFAGLLLDVCCFLKRLEDVERERIWPPRSAKIVLQLGLDRLARHYGFAGEARGPARARLRTWVAADGAPTADGR